MSRSGYTDDCENMNLYRGTVTRAVRGQRGQALLKTLLKAMDEMPEKRLIKNELVDGAGGVCLLGIGGKSLGISDLEKIQPDDHHVLAERFNVAQCLIREIEYENDDGNWNSYDETPEQRWERMRKWLVKNIVEKAA